MKIFLWLLPKNNQYLMTQIIVLNFRQFFPKFQKFAVPKKHIFAQLYAQIFGLKIFEQILRNYLQKFLGVKKIVKVFLQIFAQIFG